MDEFLVYGIPVSVLILGLIQFFKSQGLDTKWAPSISLALGVVFAVLSQVASEYSAFDAWYKVIVMGVYFGLMACGEFSAVKKLRGK